MAFAALWFLTRTLPGVDALAPFVLLVGCSILLLAVVDPEGGPVLFCIPALMLVLVAVRDERTSLYLSGVVLATSLALAGLRWVRAGEISIGRGIVLVVAGLGPAVSLPFATDGLTAAFITSAGAIAMVVVSAHWRIVRLDVIMIACCAAVTSPTVPLRSSLFTFVLAAMILLFRRPGVWRGALLVAVVIVAGKWYLPVLVAVAAGLAVDRYRSSRVMGGAGHAVVPPLLSGIPVTALSTLSIAPDVWAGLRTAGAARVVTAVVLVGGSFLVQPSLATLYVLAAVACLVMNERRYRYSPALVGFVLAMTSLTAWSGVLNGSFPLPIPFAVIVLLGLAGTLLIAGHASGVLADPAREADGDVRGATDGDVANEPFVERPDANGLLTGLTSALIAGIAVAIVILHPLVQPAGDEIATDLRLASGESVVIELPGGTKTVRLKIAGGNLAEFGAGMVAGVARAEPGGRTREIRIGEFADWGVTRRQHYLSASNPRSANPGGSIRGEGRGAFLSGSGVLRLDVEGADRLTIEALDSIGVRGRLMIESVEVER